MLIILLSFGIFAYNSKSSAKIQIIIAYNNKKIFFYKNLRFISFFLSMLVALFTLFRDIQNFLN